MSRNTRKRRLQRRNRGPHEGNPGKSEATLAYERSRKCLRDGDLDGASRAIGEVLAVDPDYPNAHNFAGWILLALPRPTPAQLERALAHFREAARSNALEAVPLVNQCTALVALGRDAEAIALMESLVADNRFKVEALNWLGWHLGLQRGELERGLSLLLEATQAGPWNAKPWLNLGALHERRGDRSQACFAYQMALGCGDLEDKKAVKTRVRELEKALIAAGEEPPIVIRLMTGQLAGPELVAIERACRAKRYEDAIVALGRLGPSDLVDAIGIAYHAAQAAHAAGRIESARELQRFVVRGHEIYASGATSGAEGLGRMHDVREMQQLLWSWGG